MRPSPLATRCFFFHATASARTADLRGHAAQTPGYFERAAASEREQQTANDGSLSSASPLAGPAHR